MVKYIEHNYTERENSVIDILLKYSDLKDLGYNIINIHKKQKYLHITTYKII